MWWVWLSYSIGSSSKSIPSQARVVERIVVGRPECPAASRGGADDPEVGDRCEHLAYDRGRLRLGRTRPRPADARFRGPVLRIRRSACRTPASELQPCRSAARYRPVIPVSSCSSPLKGRRGIVRRGLTPIARRMRAASIITAHPPRCRSRRWRIATVEVGRRSSPPRPACRCRESPRSRYAVRPSG